MSEPLSWTPERNGELYCAPACGRGCTHDEYLVAERNGAELAKTLGPDWKYRTWENLGWHYEAISPCGCISVHANAFRRSTTYTAYFEVPSTTGQWISSAKTPRAAVKAAIRGFECEMAWYDGARAKIAMWRK